MIKSFSLVTASAASIPPVRSYIVRRVEIVPAIGCLTVEQVATALRCPNLVDVLIEAGALGIDGIPSPDYVELGMLAIGYDIETGERVSLFTGEGQVWLSQRLRAGRIH